MKQDNYEIIVEYMIENQNKFYRLAYTYVNKQEDALDVVQNAICKALEGYVSIRNIDAIKTWFYRILVNESINFLKKNRKEIMMDEVMSEDTAYYEQGYEEQEDLCDEINKLSFEVQTIIKLRFYEEMSLQEIADITNLNVNTVKTKLYRGLELLRQEIQEVSI